MGEILNPFDNDAFTVGTMTGSINKLPNMYGRLKEKNLFPGQGIRTRTVVFEEKDGVLRMVESKPVGAPGAQHKSGKRRVKSFVIPHLPLDDTILPAEYDGIRGFGTENELVTLVALMNDHLQELKNKHDITKEWLRLGALKGLIVDGDGETVLYNLYDEFDLTKKTMKFALAADTTNVRQKCLGVSRHIEQNLRGEVSTGTEVLCSPEFFDKLIDHESVVRTYEGHQEASDRLGGDPRKGFRYGGLVFEEYAGKIPDSSGGDHRLIEEGKAHAYPAGTMKTFRTFYAPADFNEAVGTVGQEYYAKQEPRKFGRGVDIHTQSNPLPLCMRPEVLVELDMAT